MGTLTRGVPAGLFLAFLALLAVVALGSGRELVGLLLALLAGFPLPVGWANLAILMVLGVIGLAGLAATLRLPARPALVIAVAVLLVTRLVALWLVDPPLVRDAAAYDNLARGVLEGECCFGLRPMGYPILLAGTYVLGLSGKIAGFVAALAAGPLLWYLGRSLAGVRAGIVAVYLYAVMPSLALYSAVLMTETVYATILLAGFLPLATRPRASSGALSGLVLGLAQYVRATSVYLAPVFLLPLLARRARRSAAAAFVLALSITLLPVLLATGGISTSTVGGLSLMMGTNQRSVGWYNRADVELYLSWGADRERRAMEEAVRRVVSDPPGFALLTVRKAQSMWMQEYYGVTFALTDAGAPDSDQAAARLASQAVYVGVLVAAVAAGWRLRQSRPLLVWLILGTFATVAAIHVFVEVQPRFHAYLVPMFVLLATTAVRRPENDEHVAGLAPASAGQGVQRNSEPAVPNDDAVHVQPAGGAQIDHSS